MPADKYLSSNLEISLPHLNFENINSIFFYLKASKLLKHKPLDSEMLKLKKKLLTLIFTTLNSVN